MKRKSIRLLAFVCTCFMLVSLSTFAVDNLPRAANSMSHECSCWSTGASASTYSNLPVNLTVSFEGTYWTDIHTSGVTRGSGSNAGTSVHCSDSYPTAITASIESYHEAGSEYGWDSDRF